VNQAFAHTFGDKMNPETLVTAARQRAMYAGWMWTTRRLSAQKPLPALGRMSPVCDPAFTGIQSTTTLALERLAVQLRPFGWNWLAVRCTTTRHLLGTTWAPMMSGRCLS